MFLLVVTVTLWNNVGLAQTQWGKFPDNPVLDWGTFGEWDDGNIYDPTVIFDGTEYKMWYQGSSGSLVGIGYATSPDGISWTKYFGNPVILGGTGWESLTIGYPMTLYDGSEYKMWYAGSDGSNLRIGYATSPDGISWTKYSGNPVMSIGANAEWDDLRVCGTTIIYDGAQYKMWYMGNDGSLWKIGYATSPDGISWTKYMGNPVLDLGVSGQWDSMAVILPTVIHDGTEYKMWYVGSEGANLQIGLATSPDGITWTKHPDNPVLIPGENGTWDDRDASYPSVLLNDKEYKMWYGGRDANSGWKIGYATSELPFLGKNLSIASVYAAPGEAMTIPIKVDDAADIAGADIEIIYDETLLTVEDVSLTELSAEMNLVYNNLPGDLIMSISNTTPIPEGSGALVDIVFKVAPDAALGSKSTLAFQDAELYDELGATLESESQNGEIRIPLKGDVNGNNVVQSNDAILVMRYVVGLTTFTDIQKLVADMDGDGRIRTSDAILILRTVAGLPLPAPDEGIMAGPFTVSLDEAHGIAGERITVPLRVDSISGLAGGDVCIAYDPAVLRAVDVSSDSRILLVSNVKEPGIVRVAFTGIMNSETVAKIQFHVLADSASRLELKAVNLYGPYAQPLSSRCIDRMFISWAMAPERNALLQNFPNPFNPETWLPYQLREKSEVTIRIYSASGELVRKLDLGYKNPGFYISRDRAAYWDGKNRFGMDVASGLYFYSIQAGDFFATRKLIVVK